MLGLQLIMSIQLFFSGQFLKSQVRVGKMLQILGESGKSFVISQEGITDSQTMIAYGKLKLISHAFKMSNPILSLKIWLESDFFTSLLLKKQAINVLIIEDKQRIPNLTDANNIIILKGVDELKDIFMMSIFDLEKRCKMQRIMRMSQSKWLSNDSRARLRIIAITYTQRIQSQSLRLFLQFMRFNTKWYKAKIQKCFNLWLIETYQRSIQKTNENIVKQKHFCQSNQIALISTCFKAWKKGISKKNLRKLSP